MVRLMPLEELQTLTWRDIIGLSLYCSEESIGVVRWDYIRNIVKVHGNLLLANAMGDLNKSSS